MKEIIELREKIPAVLGAAIEFCKLHREFATMQDVVYCLQMSINWYGEAAQNLSDLMAGEHDARLPGSISEPQDHPPFTASRDVLEYLKTSLISLEGLARRIRTDLLLPPEVAQFYDAGTFNIIQAKFSTFITYEYYEQQVKYLSARGIDTRGT